MVAAWPGVPGSRMQLHALLIFLDGGSGTCNFRTEDVPCSSSVSQPQLLLQCVCVCVCVLCLTVSHASVRISTSPSLGVGKL